MKPQALSNCIFGYSAVLNDNGFDINANHAIVDKKLVKIHLPNSHEASFQMQRGQPSRMGVATKSTYKEGLY